MEGLCYKCMTGMKKNTVSPDYCKKGCLTNTQFWLQAMHMHMHWHISINNLIIDMCFKFHLNEAQDQIRFLHVYNAMAFANMNQQDL